MRATIDFRMYARVLLEIAREREREGKFIFGVALYSIARENISEVWLHATPLLMTLM